MTTYTGNRAEDHEGFILDELLPRIVVYARASSTPSEVVALACFLGLATILQAKGLGRDTLLKALDASRLPTIHEAPEGLH